VATWQGWQTDLLKAAGLPTSADNRTFLTDWGAAEKTNCTNNPVVISFKARGSTNCKPLTNTRTAQNYQNHGQAGSAFSNQLHSGNFPHLLGALRDGTPFSVPSPHDVIADLIVWGAVNYAFQLEQNYGPGQPPPPSGGGGVHDSHALNGWNDLRHVVNHDMRPALLYSQRTTAAALRRLGHARKVGR